MANHKPEPVDWVSGDETGLRIPAHVQALRAGGEAFLTDAFRVYGWLSAADRVEAIERLEPCSGGSTGRKAFLTLCYAGPGPAPPAELFVKFSRDFDDARRDQGRREMEGEVRFAHLSGQQDFPIRIPRVAFADYEAASGTGVLIAERIGFGRDDGIEPQRLKGRDDLIPDPLPYYHTLLDALARLAGAHKGGRLGPGVETRFPFDPATGSSDPIRYDDAGLEAALQGCEAFAARGAGLLPAELRSSGFLQRLATDARRVKAHEPAIRSVLTGDPRLIALCHWNAHIDNAWFWRDAAGELRCGLLDWGRASQITLGAALWGCLSATRLELWREHLDDLLAHFAEAYRRHGGPAVAADALKTHFVLHVAAMGVARVLAMPTYILHRAPDAFEAKGPLDPIISDNESARTCLQVYTLFLELCRTGAMARALDEAGIAGD